jgi:hypothetical protein
MFAGNFLADLHEDCSFQPIYVRAGAEIAPPVKKTRIKPNQIKLAKIGAKTHQKRLEPSFCRWMFDSCFSK